MPVSTSIPITGPAFNIGPGLTGKILRLTDTSPGHNEAGGVAMHFAMTTDWAGAITLLCRSAVKDAADIDLPFIGPWPFRAFYLNGVPYDGSTVAGATAAFITSTSSIVALTPGQMLALEVACTAGSCSVFYQPVAGSTAL